MLSRLSSAELPMMNVGHSVAPLRSGFGIFDSGFNSSIQSLGGGVPSLGFSAGSPFGSFGSMGGGSIQTSGSLATGNSGSPVGTTGTGTALGNIDFSSLFGGNLGGTGIPTTDPSTKTGTDTRILAGRIELNFGMRFIQLRRLLWPETYPKLYFLIQNSLRTIEQITNNKNTEYQ